MDIAELKEKDFFKAIKVLPFVDEIYLFGSRARGDHAEKSDVDLAIFAPTATDADWEKICEIIDDADTLLKIDCLHYDKISSDALLQDINQNHISLYKK